MAKNIKETNPNLSPAEQLEHVQKRAFSDLVLGIIGTRTRVKVVCPECGKEAFYYKNADKLYCTDSHCHTRRVYKSKDSIQIL